MPVNRNSTLLFLFFLLIVFCFSSCASESDKNTDAINDFIHSINKYDVSVIENYIGAEKMPLFRQLYSYTDKRRLVFDSVFVEGNMAYAIDFNSDTLKIRFERNEGNFKIFLNRNSMLSYFGDKISESEYFPIVSYYLNLDDTANSNYFYQLQIAKSSQGGEFHKHKNLKSMESIYFYEIEATMGNQYACLMLHNLYPNIYTEGRKIFFQNFDSHYECNSCLRNGHDIEYCKQICEEDPSVYGFKEIMKFYEEHLIEDSAVFWKARADKLELEEEKVDAPAYCVEDFPKFHLISE